MSSRAVLVTGASGLVGRQVVARLSAAPAIDTVVALDLRGISSATDYFLLATGQSDVQVKAIADHVIGELKREGVRPAHVEGLQGGRWVLVDYIEFVVHIFHPGARDFYQLEVLWGDAPKHDFE